MSELQYSSRDDHSDRARKTRINHWGQGKRYQNWFCDSDFLDLIVLNWQLINVLWTCTISCFSNHTRIILHLNCLVFSSKIYLQFGISWRYERLLLRMPTFREDSHFECFFFVIPEYCTRASELLFSVIDTCLVIFHVSF